MSKCSSVPTLRTQNSGATPKTPKRRKCTDPVEVFCRLRPLLTSDAGDRCLEQISETTVKLTAPVGSQGSRNHAVSMFYTFNSIFDEQSTQKSVFDKLALPMVHDLILGKNGLLFAYGVTCSGKTHTMIGETDNPGILPRCLDVVFNSIGENQAKPYIFLPDESNGMTIQAEYNAALMKNNVERQKRQAERLKKSNKNEATPDKPSEIRIPDSTKLECVNEDSAYAVFISYTEVYNKYIFDLLADEQVDEFGQPVLPESKSVREDTKRKVMYVNNVKEVEVKSTEEACDQLWKGQERRRRAETLLNDRSSRSHSVFTIRLVQAPYDEQGNRILMNKDQITISQLSLVDLAGSERPSRTKAVGEQLKEAGNINSSLMTLHTCLEILRHNQLSGRTKEKLVPYRDNKLTFLFKNYFEGEGRVRMAVCVNPRSEDYDETIHVMKFAEMTQDVVVARGQEVQFNENLAPGRRKNNLLFKRVSEGGAALADITNKSFGFNLPSRPPAFSLPPMPVWRVQEGSCSEDNLQAVLSALHERQRLKKEALEDYEKRQQRMKAVILQLERENEAMSSANAGNSDELKLLRAELSQANNDKARLEKENMKQKRENEKLKKQNALYVLEQRRIEEDRAATEERVRKEKLKRENMKKTFKGVVGREKDKWEKQTERLLLKHELAGARQDAKLRQVLEIVGGVSDGESSHSSDKSDSSPPSRNTSV